MELLIESRAMLSLDDLTLDSWVTSDQHWEHPNIRVYQDRPEDHFDRMRRAWLRLVGPDDVILHLGDIVCFGNQDSHPDWIEGLPGRKMLIRGNHDKHTDAWYEAAGFTVLGRGNKPHFWFSPQDGKCIGFSHEPDTEVYGWTMNIHGHLHANPHYPSTPSNDYRNVCVELTDYAPVRVRDVIYGDAGGRRLP